MHFDRYSAQGNLISSVKKMHCGVCKVTLNSIQQYNQHIAGKAHAKKVNAAGKGNTAAASHINFVPASGDSHLHSVQAGPFPNFGAWPRTPFHPPPPPSSQYAPAGPPRARNPSGSKNKPKKKPPPQPPTMTSSSDEPYIMCDGVSVVALSALPTDPWCAICQVQLNSAEQAEQHYSGAKHVKKARLHRMNEVGGFAQTSAGPGEHFCSFCCINVNSQEQMEIHRSGAQHRKQVEKRKLRQESVEEPPAKIQAGMAEVGDSTTPVPSPGHDFASALQVPAAPGAPF